MHREFDRSSPVHPAWKLPLIGQIAPGPAVGGHTEHTTAISLDALFARNPGRARELLQEYFPKYLAAFPDEDEVLDLRMLEEITRNHENSWDISVIRKRGEIVGGYHTLVAQIGEYTASLGDYLWVAPSERGTGLAQRVYHHILDLRREAGVAAHFGEVNDPHTLPAEKRLLEECAGSSPDARIRFWSKLGRLAVDAPWLQPPLTPTAQEVNYLMLTVHPLTGTFGDSISRAEYLALWDAFYGPFLARPEVAETRKKLVGLLPQGERIHFVKMTQPRSHLR